MADNVLDIIFHVLGMEKASAGIKQVGKDLKDVGGKETQSGLNATSAAFEKLGQKVLAGVTVAAVVHGLKEAMDATMKWGAQIDTLGDMFGMSGQEASAWSVAMQHVGVSVQEGAFQLNYFTRMLNETGKAMAEGKGATTPFGESLDKLGVSAQDSSGKLKTFDQLMPEIMDAFKELPAGIEATAIAMDLFGARGGSKFLDFLRMGSAGLEDADAKAKAFGLSLNTLDSNRVEELGFKVNDLGMRFEGLKVNIGLGLIGPLEAALGLLDQFNALTASKGTMRVNAQGEWELAPEAMYTPAGADTDRYGGETAAARAAREARERRNAALMEPFGDAGARWAQKSPWLTGAEGQDPFMLAAKYTAAIRGGMGTGAAGGLGGGLGGGMPAGLSMGFPDVLARAFGGNLGAAQGWMGAFSAQHGGAAPGATDVRDKLAGDLFMQQKGRAATQEEWEQRYYKGGFEGVDETGLDAAFGPSGTLATKLDEQKKADADHTKELIEAFDKATNKVLTVKFEKTRITDDPPPP